MAIKIDLSSLSAGVKTDKVSSAGKNKHDKAKEQDNVIKDRVELSSDPGTQGPTASEKNGITTMQNVELQGKTGLIEGDRTDYPSILEQINAWHPSDFFEAMECHNIDGNIASQMLGALMS